MTRALFEAKITLAVFVQERECARALGYTRTEMIRSAFDAADGAVQISRSPEKAHVLPRWRPMP